MSIKSLNELSGILEENKKSFNKEMETKLKKMLPYDVKVIKQGDLNHIMIALYDGTTFNKTWEYFEHKDPKKLSYTSFYYNTSSNHLKLSTQAYGYSPKFQEQKGISQSEAFKKIKKYVDDTLKIRKQRDNDPQLQKTLKFLKGVRV